MSDFKTSLLAEGYHIRPTANGGACLCQKPPELGAFSEMASFTNTSDLLAFLNELYAEDKE